MQPRQPATTLLSDNIALILFAVNHSAQVDPIAAEHLGGTRCKRINTMHRKFISFVV
jgi:hypothetical protein